jgi:ABC-2 type transport system ATP-binding protein
MELCLNNLSKSYGSIKALSDFNYTFTPGIHALLGPNGSGKSTLINIITDNLKADNGNITYDGKDTLKSGVSFREKIGFMPQYPGMYPAFSVNDFLKYISVLKGLEKKESKRQIDNLLEAVELSDVKNYKIKTLSGGMKQRLALAQALLGNPEIVILDEPTAGLDPKQRITIRNYISSISLNKIIIIATHIVSDVEYIAKDVIFLKKGVIEDAAPPNEVIKKIQGFVWNVPVLPEDVEKIQNNFKVLNINNSDSGIYMRILSQDKPTENAEEISPTLEDYYLYIFGDIL